MYMIYVKKNMECLGGDNMIFSIYDYKPTLKDVAIFMQNANKDEIFGVDCQLQDISMRKIKNGEIINFWRTKNCKI